MFATGVLGAGKSDVGVSYVGTLARSIFLIGVKYKLDEPPAAVATGG